MTVVTFREDLYDGFAIDLAAKTYARFATFDLEKGDGLYKVGIAATGRFDALQNEIGNNRERSLPSMSPSAIRSTRSCSSRSSGSAPSSRRRRGISTRTPTRCNGAVWSPAAEDRRGGFPGGGDPVDGDAFDRPTISVRRHRN